MCLNNMQCLQKMTFNPGLLKENFSWLIPVELGVCAFVCAKSLGSVLFRQLSRRNLDFPTARPDINVLGSRKLAAIGELPANDGNDEYGNADIGRNKARRVPVTLQEDRETTNKRDDDRADKAEPGGVWLPRCLPGQRITTDALDRESAVESDVGEAESGPCDETCYCAEVEKPAECLSSTTGTET